MVHSSIDTPATGEVDPRRYLERAGRLPLKLTWRLVGWLIGRGHLVEADELLSLLERQRGPSATLCEQRARLALAAGDADAQVAWLRERVALAPSNTAQVALATALLQAGELAEAQAISRELDRLAPDLQSVAALRAKVAEATGDLAAARAAHEELLERNPEQLTPLFAIAEIDLREGRTAEAAALARHALDLAGDQATPSQISRCIAILRDTGDTSGAEELQSTLEEAEARAAEAQRQREAAFIADLNEAIFGGSSPHPGAEAPPLSQFPERGDAARSGTAKRSGGGTNAHRNGLPSPKVGRRVAEGRGEGQQPEILQPTPDPEQLDPRVLPALHELFGYDTLRPGQGAVIANVLAGRDTLATMPTGAGKSLTFQLPAMLREGTTLVLSPLIALMADQVASLPPAIREKSLLVNSTLSRREMQEALARIAAGGVKLVYAAPERLRDTAFLDALRDAGTSLVVIDEAHCISLWGHDFRPDYLTIPRALPAIGTPSILAITATATPGVANGIAQGLGRPLDRIRASVFRPNLFYEAHHHANRDQKVAHLLDICQRERGVGIVYVPSRNDAERLAGLLRSRRINAVPYHAGLDKEVRTENQRAFMQGEARIVVATVAFGMGINKADVRFIVHFRPPMSIAAYAQESGRAGRDGKPARCILLVTHSDRSSLRRLAHRDEIDLPMLRQVYAAIQRQRVDRWAIVDFAAIEQSLDVDEDDGRDRARIGVGVLDQAGLIARHQDVPVDRTLWRRPGAGVTDDDLNWNRFLDWSGLAGGGMVRVRTAMACAELGCTPGELEELLLAHADDVELRQEGPRLACLELKPAPADATGILQSLIARTREEAHRRIDEVFDYADTRKCRHVVLAAHLGERIEPCGDVCDVCRGRAAHAPSHEAVEAAASPQRRATTAADALAVLTAVRTLPFPMGKTGLVRLITGSAESRVRGDRSPSFGALQDVVKTRVDALIDRLIDDGYLFRDVDHEYKLIHLTEKGAAASEAELAAYNPAGGVPDESAPLDGSESALFERLAAWRLERAARDGVPPYVVAHDTMLRAVARQRPGTPAELGTVSGFGGKRVAKYGDEILAIAKGF